MPRNYGDDLEEVEEIDERRPNRSSVHLALMSVVRSAIVPVAMIAILLVGRMWVASASLQSAVLTEIRESKPTQPWGHVCLSEDKKTFSVYLTAHGEIDCDGRLVEGFAGLQKQLAMESASDRQVRAVVEADPARPYGDWLIAVDTVRKAGISDVTVRLHCDWCDELPALD